MLTPPQGSKHMTRVPHSAAIRLIDFGSATWEAQYHSSVVSTRHYRAPEVILGLPWSYPCDAWSVGCILAELLTGDALFQTHENLEHLAMMEAILGPLPSSLVARADRHAAPYFRSGRLNWPDGASSHTSVRAVRKLRRLRELVGMEGGARDFAELIAGLLAYEPEQRLTAAEALRHPFFADRGSSAAAAPATRHSVGRASPPQAAPRPPPRAPPLPPPLPPPPPMVMHRTRSAGGGGLLARPPLPQLYGRRAAARVGEAAAWGSQLAAARRQGCPASGQ